MRRTSPALALALLTLVSFPSCTGRSGDKGDEADEHAEPAHAEPAYVEEAEADEPYRVILSAHAATRLGVETAPVVRLPGGRTAVPYSALIYDVTGATWAYTNPEPLTFVRESVTVARIDGDRAVLGRGPAVGTQVATVGVAELYGTEFGVGH